MNRRGISNSLALILVASSAVLLSACLSGVQCPPPAGSSAAEHRRPLIGTKGAAAVTCSSGSGSGGNGTCSSTLTPNNVVFTLDGLGNILEYAINSDGSLSLMCNTAATATDGFLAVSNNSSFLYVLDASGSQIFGYLIGHSNTGTLTPMNGQPFKVTTSTPLTAGTSLLETDPQGRFLFITDLGNRLIYVFMITPGSGVLSPVQNSPFGSTAGVMSPNFLAVGGSGGSFAFVVDPNDSEILTFSLSNTGQLALVSTFMVNVVSDIPHYILLDATGTFVYTADETSIGGYTFDSSGNLFTIPNMPVSTAPAGPGILAIDSTGQFMYTNDQSVNNLGLFGFPIASGTGVVGPGAVPNSPTALIAGATPPFTSFAVLTNPAGPNLYSLQLPSSASSAVIDDYPITIASGQLTPPTAQSTLVGNNNMVTANVQ
jgi:6-phosphogluconolactonase (cycloisomerase 2 family)